jgi:hypothetical protein
MSMVQSPRKVPRRDSITGRRLGGCIFTEGEFALGYITERGAENDDHAHKTGESNEGEADVRAREDGPGFHLFFVTVVIVACCGGFGKGGLPTVFPEKISNVFTGLLPRFACIIHSSGNHFFECIDLLVG